ncbi:MAG: hypothetical protein UU47_C0007G0011 [candidate division TM6 bacterium GW2011_GWE2_41_16]|nr:MAG: hypothetical protein UU47_C0007G0011 [candidate division TM6 bacterium GW2011_GWE2_41_16]
MFEWFFILLNFAIIVALVWYFAKNYGIPSFRQSLQEEQSTDKKMALDVANTQKRAKEATRAVESQLIFNDRLFRMIALWTRKHDEWAAQRRAQLETQSNVMCKHLVSQYGTIQKRCMYRALVPKIIAQTQQNLERVYTQKEHAQSFVDTIVKNCEEQTHAQK